MQTSPQGVAPALLPLIPRASRASQPNKWAPIIAEIERLGLSWQLDPQYDLDRLDIAERRIQVRDNDHVAPKDTVARFAIQMAHSEFPPIVVTDDCWVVDGNTRKEAKRKRGEKFHPAFVLGIARENCTLQQFNLLTILGATLNSSNGLPLSSTERRKSAAAMIAESWKTEQIARALGVASGAVVQIKREIDARAKLERLNVKINGSMPLPGLRGLGTPDALALNDAPYRDLAALAKDAGLNFTEIRNIAKEAKGTGSDHMGVALLTEKRAEMRDRIASHALTGNGRPPNSAILRIRLSYLSAFVGKESELVEQNESAAGKHIEALDNAIRILHHIKGLQTS